MGYGCPRFLERCCFVCPQHLLPLGAFSVPESGHLDGASHRSKIRPWPSFPQGHHLEGKRLPESSGRQAPCHTGRREYILVRLGPASMPDTPLWQRACLPCQRRRQKAWRNDDHGQKVTNGRLLSKHALKATNDAGERNRYFDQKKGPRKTRAQAHQRLLSEGACPLILPHRIHFATRSIESCDHLEPDMNARCP
jgi:hypothetical protein